MKKSVNAKKNKDQGKKLLKSTSASAFDPVEGGGGFANVSSLAALTAMLNAPTPPPAATSDSATNSDSLFASAMEKMVSKNFAEDEFARKPTAAPSEKKVDAAPPVVTAVQKPAVLISHRKQNSQNSQASQEASLKQIFGAPVAVLEPEAAQDEVKGLPTAEESQSAKPLTELLHPKLVRSVTQKLKIQQLTRVQQQAWDPMMLPEQDVMVRSETGSGKTFAYFGPLLNRLLTDCDTSKIDRAAGTLIIVLAPTRELVEQVSQVGQVLLQNAQFITVGSIHGGDNRHKEKARLRKGIHVLVATPGRLLDHLKTTSSFDHHALQTIVLDEADRLLDMGFEKALREIMETIKPKKRVLVSATITQAVERLSHFALKNPVHVGETEDTFQVPASLRQHFAIVPAKHRLSTLTSFLKSQLDAGSKKIVVFMSTSDSCEFHYMLLSRLKNPFTSRKRAYTPNNRPDFGQRPRRKSFKKMTEAANRHLQGDDDEEPEDVITFDEEDAEDEKKEAATLDDKNSFLPVHIFKLHGNMNQVDRASVFHAFKHSSEQGILLCTDVAARGLDMPHIDWIIHYDPPTDERCYIHRVGRTARIGRVGDSMLFLMPHEAGYAEYLAKFTAMPIEEKKHEILLFYLTKLDSSSNHSWMQSTASLERRIGQTVKEDRETLGKVNLFAYQSYVRAYSGYPRAVRHFFRSEELHLGHIAHSFGIDDKPTELRKKLQSIVKAEREIGRDTSRFKKQGEKMEVDTKEVYHSSVVNKTVKNSKDWHEEKKATSAPSPKLFQFTEFDA